MYKKGYQEFQTPYSSVTTKIKGVAPTNLPGLDLYGGMFVWDTADLVIPPEVCIYSTVVYRSMCILITYLIEAAPHL